MNYCFECIQVFAITTDLFTLAHQIRNVKNWPCYKFMWHLMMQCEINRNKMENVLDFLNFDVKTKLLKGIERKKKKSQNQNYFKFVFSKFPLSLRAIHQIDKVYCNNSRRFMCLIWQYNHFASHTFQKFLKLNYKWNLIFRHSSVDMFSYTNNINVFFLRWHFYILCCATVYEFDDLSTLSLL